MVLEPNKWKTSGGQTSDKNKVQIIPLEISVPHDDVWLTIKKKEMYSHPLWRW